VVSFWLWAATVLLLALVPCLWVALRGSLLDAVVALQLVTTLVTVILILLSEGFERSAYYGLPLVLSVLAFAGTFVFLRFLEREL
jgi:multisubunit Na+/H+ antiporter MnhF subunit